MGFLLPVRLRCPGGGDAELDAPCSRSEVFERDVQPFTWNSSTLKIAARRQSQISSVKAEYKYGEADIGRRIHGVVCGFPGDSIVQEYGQEVTYVMNLAVDAVSLLRCPGNRALGDVVRHAFIEAVGDDEEGDWRHEVKHQEGE